MTVFPWRQQAFFGIILFACLSVRAISDSSDPCPLNELEEVLAQDGVSDDRFGNAVAIDGDTMMVGAPFDDDLGQDSGSVYVFERDTQGEWNQVDKLTAEVPDVPDGAPGDHFGTVVALSGGIAIIGAPRNDEAGEGAGAAYVFERDANGAWGGTHRLTAPEPGAGDRFGRSVGISGTTAVIGRAHSSGTTFEAEAYVFSKTDGSWDDGQTFSVPGDAAKFTNVAIDGTFIVLGVDRSPGLSGNAFLFENLKEGWTRTASFIDGDCGFGKSVAISGTTAVVTQLCGNLPSPPPPTNIGSAVVIERTDGVWTQTAELNPDDGDDGDEFGRMVALEQNLAVVSAPQSLLGGPGAAYVFAKSPSTQGWTRIAKLTASDGTSDDNFGDSVAAISGARVAVGDPLHDDEDLGEASGAAYLFQVDDCNDNGVGDICEVSRVSLMDEGFQDGLPGGWTVSGLWHVTDQCSPSGNCAPAASAWAYFGRDDTCQFDIGARTFGTLSSPTIRIPARTITASLTYCSAYEGEAGDATNEGFDWAWVEVCTPAGCQVMDNVSLDNDQIQWETRRIALGQFRGTDITVSWHFDSVDAVRNDEMGWEVANVVVHMGPTSPDCNRDFVPDECQLVQDDCNRNTIPDDCDIGSGRNRDCNMNDRPDACESVNNDSNRNAVPDDCEPNCEGGQPDECRISVDDGGLCDPEVQNDCLSDCSGNGISDQCEEDCHADDPAHSGHARADDCDILEGISSDCNDNGKPDDCESAASCNPDQGLDICVIANCPSEEPACDDCNGNGVPDECDILIEDGGLCDPGACPKINYRIWLTC